ncbi:MAG: hypothetical protein IKP92_09440 [Lachnospiraceae bacterium]|nr:hypothetical protein [Lachnospiraceae bacterium]
MRSKSKLLRVFLSIVLIIPLTMGLPNIALASNGVHDDGLVSVEVISNAVADSMLPENLYQAVVAENNPGGGISPKGLSEPDSNSVWNLNSNGQYNFHVNVTVGTIYSNYVFTGHGGQVEVHLVENTATSGKYKFRLYKRGIFNTVLYTYQFDHGSVQTISMSSFASDAKIFFEIEPNGYTNLTNSSYIKKN